MEIHYLDKLFNPHSIAVIGASDKPLSVGAKVFSNLLADFSGKVFPVNPKHKMIQGKPCFSSVKKISQPIDLAVITTPAACVPQVMKECGEKNVRHAIILSAGFGESMERGKELEQTIIELAQQFKIRFIGPNCLGIRNPFIGLNATFESSPILSGNLAFVSQSGALCAAILDWAFQEQVGFSSVVSLGNSADIGFGEVLDYLALDAKTDCILLYIEGIRNARKFMSGLRAASRLKPIIAIKAGRNSQGTRAAISHTGAMIGADDVFDAALRRAGVVRVASIKELFSAAEVFSSSRRSKGERLMILTNGGGAGVMAADRAADLNIPLPELTNDTISYLDSVLPRHWSHHNPIDILGDATPERYQQVMSACLKDENCDGLLTILIPVSMSEPLKVAEQVNAISQQSDKPILTCWMGKTQVEKANHFFAQHKIPSFSTPEMAVEAFSYLATYHHNQQLLLQVPEPLSYQSQPDINGAQLIIESAIAEHRKILTTTESKAILRAFGIPITQTLLARTATEALIAAESLGFPVVMKIYSPDITHKQDVSGVQLNITNAEAVRAFFYQLIDNAKKKLPNATLIGVTVEPMYKTANDRELMVGVIKDPVFGPTINFGAGGSLIEIMQDRAIALPPLNKYLTENLIARTRIAKLLGEFRNKPAVNIAAVEDLLLRISEMVCELPQIEEMDINPLIANDKEVVAVDARIVINFETPLIPYSHLAIHPYPVHLISHWQLADGTPITIRPIRPEDATSEQNFIRQLSQQTKYFRFMGGLRELTPEMLKRTTQIDYDREMAMVAVIPNNAQEAIIGIAHYNVYPDFQTCEFALVIADQWQNKGIGSHLLSNLMAVAKSKNLRTVEGVIMSANLAMLALAKNLGFSMKAMKEDPTLLLAKKSLV
ncbi:MULTISPECIES: bifunctional acetate--CoA ligase family protein/GNAT family N-acetyltransferase [Legionella]|uniref:Acetyltransferase Pat n=1 Tax=Legionella maceachernii TaxID=466 RepID=A0A0W0WDM1_9GAMM|nr:bifunctional acetate--CoA ligase family protein/GNAT family N-acetyltransferase [Legionella maceachernii]KTD30469.1 Acetyltransferase Pat [Legionella maceachernii]SJZ68067.1 acetyltransferase [Legionella maceachernii]SUP02113.1 succinyl-CoA synthetase subunit alpha [Legionella maceachernii]